jgi:hypothetical protein
MLKAECRPNFGPAAHALDEHLLIRAWLPSTGPECAGVHHASAQQFCCCQPVQWTVLAVVAFALAVLVYSERFGGGSGEPQPLRRPRGSYYE